MCPSVHPSVRNAFGHALAFGLLGATYDHVTFFSPSISQLHFLRGAEAAIGFSLFFPRPRPSEDNHLPDPFHNLPYSYYVQLYTRERTPCRSGSYWKLLLATKSASTRSAAAKGKKGWYKKLERPDLSAFCSLIDGKRAGSACFLRCCFGG